MIQVKVYWQEFKLVSELTELESLLDRSPLGIYDKVYDTRYTYDGKPISVLVTSLRSVPSVQLDAIVLQTLADYGYKASKLTVNIPERKRKPSSVNEKQRRLF